MPENNPESWRSDVVYQIYPRSFADSNGDGDGDLLGIKSRVPHLRALGVNAVWLNPFYPSALADGGYDVDDHRDVDPRHGTLDGFESMADALHQADIKVIVDIVPNHTSDRHVWFKEALLAGRGSPARERYIFRDGAGPDGSRPPNDWESMFGGPAWARTGDGQWFFHAFAPEQPDLNWDHPDVPADFEKTIRFWADKGADGFRIDVAHGMRKDLSEPYLPWGDIKDHHLFVDGSHPLWDRNDVHDIYAAWRRIFNSYDPPKFGVAEADVHPSRRARYASPEGLGQSFNFAMQEAGWKTDAYRRVIDFALAEAGVSGSTNTWLLDCHDAPRVATRYGFPEVPGVKPNDVVRQWLQDDRTVPPPNRIVGERRARAAALVKLGLPGAAYIYQGDELGLHEVSELRPDELIDPIAKLGGGKGRDGCRVPLPWTADGPSHGFGSGRGFLPQPHWFGRYSVAAQSKNPFSTLSMYRLAIAQRRQLLAGEDFEWVRSDEEVLHFRRPSAQGRAWHIVANFNGRPAPLPEGEVVASSARLEYGRLPHDAAAWVLER